MFETVPPSPPVPTRKIVLPTPVAPITDRTSPTRTAEEIESSNLISQRLPTESSPARVRPTPSPSSSPELSIITGIPTKETPEDAQIPTNSSEVSLEISEIPRSSLTVGEQQRQDVSKAELSPRTGQMWKSRYASEPPADVQTWKAIQVSVSTLDAKPPPTIVQVGHRQHGDTIDHEARMSSQRSKHLETLQWGPTSQAPGPAHDLRSLTLGKAPGRERINNAAKSSSKQSEGLEARNRTSTDPSPGPSKSHGGEVQKTVPEAKSLSRKQQNTEAFSRPSKGSNFKPKSQTKHGWELAKSDPGTRRFPQEQLPPEKIEPEHLDSNNSNGLSGVRKGPRNGKSVPRRGIDGSAGLDEVASSSKQRQGQRRGNPGKKR